MTPETAPVTGLQETFLKHESFSASLRRSTAFAMIHAKQDPKTYLVDTKTDEDNNTLFEPFERRHLVDPAVSRYCFVRRRLCINHLDFN